MKIRDLISVVLFLREARGCVIMKDDISRLEVHTFGNRTYPVIKCEEDIMSTIFKNCIDNERRI